MDESHFEHGPRRKLERASKHLDALHMLAEDLRADADFDSVIVEHDPDAGDYVLCSAMTLDNPLGGWPGHLSAIIDDLGLVLGDFVHNARGALDHVAWRLARQHLGRDPTESEARGIQFPITKNPANFASSRVLRYVSAVAGTCMEGMQPYKAADLDKHPLAVLHWLSNRDKHRLVIPSFTQRSPFELGLNVSPEDATVSLRVRDFEAEPFRVFRGRVEWGRFEVVPATPGQEVEVSVDHQAPRSIGFAGPLHDVDLDELAAILAAVRVNVEALDRLL